MKPYILYLVKTPICYANMENSNNTIEMRHGLPGRKLCSILKDMRVESWCSKNHNDEQYSNKIILGISVTQEQNKICTSFLKKAFSFWNILSFLVPREKTCLSIHSTRTTPRVFRCTIASSDNMIPSKYLLCTNFVGCTLQGQRKIIFGVGPLLKDIYFIWAKGNIGIRNKVLGMSRKMLHVLSWCRFGNLGMK